MGGSLSLKATPRLCSLKLPFSAEGADSKGWEAGRESPAVISSSMGSLSGRERSLGGLWRQDPAPAAPFFKSARRGQSCAGHSQGERPVSQLPPVPRLAKEADLFLPLILQFLIRA